MRHIILLLPVIALINVVSWSVNKSYETMQKEEILPETARLHEAMYGHGKNCGSSYRRMKIAAKPRRDSDNGL